MYKQIKLLFREANNNYKPVAQKSHQTSSLLKDTDKRSDTYS